MAARTRTALILGGLWCVAIIGFALSASYPLALGFLFIAGFVELSFNAMAQTLVQLDAPAAIRGRVIGFFNMLPTACAPSAASPSASAGVSSAFMPRWRSPPRRSWSCSPPC
jgi:hypothetical protein